MLTVHSRDTRVDFLHSNMDSGALTLATPIDFLVNRPAPVIPFLRFFMASFFVFVLFFMHDVSRLAFLSLLSAFMPCTRIGLSTPSTLRPLNPSHRPFLRTTATTLPRTVF